MMRVGVAGAAALALMAGTIQAQPEQPYRPGAQLDQRTAMEYRDAGEWRAAEFVHELSQEIVVLKGETEDYNATVHILYGQVEAKLDDERISTQQVEKKGDRLRILDQEGETLVEFTLPDLQTIQEARMTAQPGAIDRQFGVEDPWREDGRRREDWRQQEDWRFRDRRQMEMWDDPRFRDDRRDDQRFRDDRMMRDDPRFRDDRMMMRDDDWRTFDRRFEREHAWGMDREPYQPRMRRPIEQQMGISVSTATPRDLAMTRYRQGLKIEHVERGSPLDSYGIRPGDIIATVDGRPATRTHLQRTITRMDHRDTMRMTLLRDGRERTISLRGAEVAGFDRFDPRFERFDREPRVLGVPDPAVRPAPVIGVQVDKTRRAELPRTAVGARYDTGLTITRVLDGSPADRAGLRRGDIIVEINGQPDVTTTTFQQEIAMLHPGETLNVTVIRDGRERQFNIRVRERDLREFEQFDPRFEEPSRVERLFFLPGQVPPGPDVHYRPRADEPRWERRPRWDDPWENRWDDRRDDRRHERDW